MTSRLQVRLNHYTDAMTMDMQAIQAMLDQTREMAETTDPRRIHELTLALTGKSVAGNWVQAPRHYVAADWYMIAMERLMTLAGLSDFDVLLPKDAENVAMVFPKLGVPAAFAFEVNPDANGGAYFVEVETGQRLFYWNLQYRQFKFNAHALTALFLENFKGRTSTEAIRLVTGLLTEFARYMERTFTYTVDYNLLETVDGYNYPLMQKDSAHGMLDRLFIMSADTGYFLQSMSNGGAIVLNNNVEVQMLFTNDATEPGAKSWQFQVLDGRDHYSWLDVLLAHDFMADWYLAEQANFEVAYDQLVFAETQTLSTMAVKPMLTQAQAPAADDTVAAALQAAANMPEPAMAGMGVTPEASDEDVELAELTLAMAPEMVAETEPMDDAPKSRLERTR